MKAEKKKTIDFADREQLVRDAQRYTLFDDTFMNAVLQDNEACQHVLGIITGISHIQVVESKTQYALKSVSTRSAFLDVLAKDAEDRFYNVELQKGEKDSDGKPMNHAKRVRLYGSLFDGGFTAKGAVFDNVPDLISIYLGPAENFV